MSIAKIVVPLRGTPTDDVALATAFAVARLSAAHVYAIFVRLDPGLALAHQSLTLRPDIVQNMVETSELLAKEAAKAAHASFTATAAQAKADIGPTFRKYETLSASYREATGYLRHVLSDAALLSDLVVFPPVAHSADPELREAFVDILMATGRPVLLAPAKAPAHVGQRLAIGWDGRRAAASALLGAMPIIEHAASVELLSIRNSARDSRSIDDARDYLAMHGVDCIERVLDPDVRPTAEALLDAADERECDLLVIGGYGHSRLLEAVFGGVTESIVSHATLPVLLVH